MIGFSEAVGSINDPTSAYLDLTITDDSYVFTLRSADTPIDDGVFYKYADAGVDLVIGDMCINVREMAWETGWALVFRKNMYDLGDEYGSVQSVNATFNSSFVKYAIANGYQRAVGAVDDVNAINMTDDGTMYVSGDLNVSYSDTAYVKDASDFNLYTGYRNYIEMPFKSSVVVYNFVSFN